MAQSPRSTQEPSMDELLASIREIIEESSAAVEEDVVPVETSFEEIWSDVMQADGVKEAEQQEISANTEPVQDAMRALAARIGLPKSSSNRAAGAGNLSAPDSLSMQVNSTPVSVLHALDQPVSAQTAAAPPSALLSVSPAASPSSTAKSASAAWGSHAVQNDIFQGRRVRMVAPSPVRSLPLQGNQLNQGNAVIRPQTPRPLPVSTPVQQAPTVQRPELKAVQTSALPQAQTFNQAQDSIQVSAGETVLSGHIPLFQQFHAMPTPVSRPLTQPSVPSQGLDQLRASSVVPATPPTSSTAAPVSNSVIKKAISSTQESEDGRKLSDLEKGTSAEFEQSAELLLRPYIAGWLEEHFHQLFERILREEIQRLMQQNLRR